MIIGCLLRAYRGSFGAGGSGLMTQRLIRDSMILAGTVELSWKQGQNDPRVCIHAFSISLFLSFTDKAGIADVKVFRVMLRSFPSNVKKFSPSALRSCATIFLKSGWSWGVSWVQNCRVQSKKSNSLVRSSTMSCRRCDQIIVFLRTYDLVLLSTLFTKDYAAAFGKYHSAIESMMDAASQLQTRVLWHQQTATKMQSISWVQTVPTTATRARWG